MWTRKEIKKDAKEFLKQNYWKSFVVVLITLVIANGFNKFGIRININDFQQNFGYIMGTQMSAPIQSEPLFILFDPLLKQFFELMRVALTTITFMAFATSILIYLIGLIIEVGLSRYFIDGLKGDVNINKLFSGFNVKDIIPIIKAQTLTILLIILWSLLFIVPGIIKAYEYRYVSYILAEDSSLKPKEVLGRSKAITKGHKAELFILDFSFILWDLLSLITFGVSSYFVAPYIYATNARLYTILSSNY